MVTVAVAVTRRTWNKQRTCPGTERSVSHHVTAGTDGQFSDPWPSIKNALNNGMGESFCTRDTSVKKSIARKRETPQYYTAKLKSTIVKHGSAHTACEILVNTRHMAQTEISGKSRNNGVSCMGIPNSCEISRTLHGDLEVVRHRVLT